MAVLNKKGFPFIVGAGFLWCWGFLYFFLDQNQISGGADVLGDVVYLISMLISCAVALVGPVRQVLVNHLSDVAYVGCALLVMGVLVFSQAGSESVWLISVYTAGKALAGAGLGLSWIAWGILLARYEIGRVENAFLGWVPLLVVVLFAAIIARTVDASGLTFNLLFAVMPLISVFFFRKASRSAARPETPTEGVPARMLWDKTLVTSFLNLACAFTVTVVSWNAILPQVSISFTGMEAVFATGAVCAFAAMWASMYTTRRFSLSTIYRWALPTVALAVSFAQVGGRVTMVLACLCLTIANVGLEVSSKLYAIHLANRNPGLEITIISLGFACPAVGSLIGSYSWQGFISVGTDYRYALLAALVLFTVQVAGTLGRESSGIRQKEGQYNIDPSAQPSVQPAHLENSVENRCCAVAAEYKLSKRESEVLILLAQGRSRAYIRESLFISKGTVDTHIAHIYSKFGVNSRDELMSHILDA